MIRAVICDDEKAALNIIEYFIENEKLPIELVGTAEDGQAALKLIQEKRPDLVFMDIRMPYMNGFEVIQKIRDTKVIVITAYDSFEYAQTALRLGADDIISKPIELEQLRLSIIRAIGWNFTGNEIVNQILTYIHTNFAEKIELEDLAKMVFCTESHIARLFKKHVGMTIVSYINKVRIDKAVVYLKEEKMSIQEAAGLTGFHNLNNFYKNFKKYMGITPALFVQNKQPEEEIK